MRIQKIFIGGWFQRTTLHLSEIYDFLKDAESPLDLDRKKLMKLRDGLDMKNLEMVVESFERIEIQTRDGINLRIFEDGLIVLNKKYSSLNGDIKILKEYYEKKLSPAINYIFSLGAPVPKELAGIKNIYPYFLILNKATDQEEKKLMKQLKQEKYFEIVGGKFKILRGDKLYIINNFGEKLENLEDFVEEQIFIREFKAQMHRYLNLHRIIWEKIANIKERGEIRGFEVGEHKNKIERYSKTINLIGARINQMNAYLMTRQSILKGKEITKLINTMPYKYENLNNTLNYLKEIWGMTKNYVDSANKMFSDLQNESTGKSVRDLTIVTSMGVGASLIGLFTQSVPKFQWMGIVYFMILVVIGYSSNKTVKYFYKRRKYKISDVEIDKNIK